MEPTIANKQKCIIKVTDFCQMQCKYCFAVGSDPQNSKRESFTMVTEFCEFWGINNINPKDYIFSFFGGEPLLEFETVMKPIILFLRNKSWTIRIQVVTNGLLLTREILEFLNIYHVMVILSIDGDEETFKVNRGHGFKQIMENYSQIIKLPRTYPASFFYGISATFNRDTLTHIIDSYNWANQLIPRPRFWYFNIDFTNTLYSDDEFAFICQQVNLLFNLYRNSAKDMRNFYFDRLLANNLFDFFPGLIFTTSGEILFGAGEDRINKGSTHLRLGHLKTGFDKDLFKEVYTQNLMKATTTQFCSPQTGCVCHECKNQKENKIILCEQKQQLYCYLQKLRGDV